MYHHIRKLTYTFRVDQPDPRFARDPALISAVQKAEHYEISAYGTARSMAQQIGQSEIALLLSKMLAEEDNADCVLTECARPLMTEAKLAEVR